MRNLLKLSVVILAIGLVGDPPAPAHAEDQAISGVSAVSTSTSSAQSAEFPCGIQVSLRCSTVDASYRVCHAVTGTTCTAVTTDQVLTAGVTYDIPIASDSGGNKCRIAFITASGSGSCSIKNVVPRTIPSNLQ